MTANELMIGDWVMPDQCRIPTLYTSVAMITTDGVYINEAERLFSFDELHGIPLTAEILEKNGFVYDYDSEECVADYTYVKSKGYQYKEDNVLIDYCNGHIRLINDITNAEIDMDINYVHELQHALRLCGIGKEIEL